MILSVLWLTPVAAQSGSGERAAEPAVQISKADSLDHSELVHPNRIPYRTRRSVFRKALSTPAYLWRGLWYPIGEGVIWMEQNHVHQKFINFFMNKARTGGVFPLAIIGGSTGFAGGFLAFHNNLWNREKQGSFRFLFGSPDNLIVSAVYTDAAMLGSAGNVSISGQYLVDDDENYFPSNRLSDNLDELETSYSTRQSGIDIRLGYRLHPAVNLQVIGGITETDIDAGQGDEGERFPLDLPGTDQAALAKLGGILTLDLRHGWPRTLSGLLLMFSYDFSSEFQSVDYQFHRYAVEAQHFLSLPFLAKNRRFSVRGRMEKVEEITGKTIPFYELSMLGDPSSLRGYAQNRFRDKGSLLFNFEYRYPVWDTWDAVIFLDEGQVFSRFDQIGLNRFHRSAGFGIRMMTQTGFILRFEVGIGQEQSRVLLEMTPMF